MIMIKVLDTGSSFCGVMTAPPPPPPGLRLSLRAKLNKQQQLEDNKLYL
jgi:hypothetical protein